MNLKTTLAATAAFLALVPLTHADSKRTAEYLLSSPTSHQDQQVTLDVSFVKPVRWVSPFPEIAFFQAVTIDRTDAKKGGSLLVAVPAETSEKFAKKYGMDFDGRYDKTTLRGEFIAAGKGKKRQIWMVDTTGQLLELIEERKKDFPNEAFGKGGKGGSEGFGKRGRRGN